MQLLAAGHLDAEGERAVLGLLAAAVGGGAGALEAGVLGGVEHHLLQRLQRVDLARLAEVHQLRAKHLAVLRRLHRRPHRPRELPGLLGGLVAKRSGVTAGRVTAGARGEGEGAGRTTKLSL